MTSNPERTRQFAKCVVQLQQSNPSQWTTFMALLAERVELATETLISSPPEQLQVNQGRSQFIRDFFRELDAAPSLVQDLIEKERTRGNAAQRQ